MAAAVVGGIWITRGNGPNPPEKTQPSPRPIVIPRSGGRQTVDIYVVKMVNDDPRLVPVERSIPADADPHVAAIEKLIATNHESGPTRYLVPLGTRLSGIEVKNGIAYVDFSRQLKDNFTGGSTNEALLVNAIVHTLRQFKDVEKVQILIQGKAIDSIGDHLDISQPIVGDSTLLGQGDEE